MEQMPNTSGLSPQERALQSGEASTADWYDADNDQAAKDFAEYMNSRPVEVDNGARLHRTANEEDGKGKRGQFISATNADATYRKTKMGHETIDGILGKENWGMGGYKPGARVFGKAKPEAEPEATPAKPKTEAKAEPKAKETVEKKQQFSPLDMDKFEMLTELLDKNFAEDNVADFRQTASKLLDLAIKMTSEEHITDKNKKALMTDVIKYITFHEANLPAATPEPAPSADTAPDNDDFDWNDPKIQSPELTNWWIDDEDTSILGSAAETAAQPETSADEFDAPQLHRLLVKAVAEGNNDEAERLFPLLDSAMQAEGYTEDDRADQLRGMEELRRAITGGEEIEAATGSKVSGNELIKTIDRSVRTGDLDSFETAARELQQLAKREAATIGDAKAKENLLRNTDAYLDARIKDFESKFGPVAPATPEPTLSVESVQPEQSQTGLQHDDAVLKSRLDTLKNWDRQLGEKHFTKDLNQLGPVILRKLLDDDSRWEAFNEQARAKGIVLDTENEQKPRSSKLDSFRDKITMRTAGQKLGVYANNAADRMLVWNAHRKQNRRERDADTEAAERRRRMMKYVGAASLATAASLLVAKGLIAPRINTNGAENHLDPDAVPRPTGNTRPISSSEVTDLLSGNPPSSSSAHTSEAVTTTLGTSSTRETATTVGTTAPPNTRPVPEVADVLDSTPSTTSNTPSSEVTSTTVEATPTSTRPVPQVEVSDVIDSGTPEPSTPSSEASPTPAPTTTPPVTRQVEVADVLDGGSPSSTPDVQPPATSPAATEQLNTVQETTQSQLPAEFSLDAMPMANAPRLNPTNPRELVQKTLDVYNQRTGMNFVWTPDEFFRIDGEGGRIINGEELREYNRIMAELASQSESLPATL